MSFKIQGQKPQYYFLERGFIHNVCVKCILPFTTQLSFIVVFYFLTINNFNGQSNIEDLQTTKKTNLFAIQASYENGYVFATNSFLKGINLQQKKINAFQSAAFKFSKQSNGKDTWEKVFKFPEWGVGINTYDFYNKEEIGRPIGIFGFIHAPFIRHDKFSFNYEIGFGASFNWKSFNPLTNNYNNAIGAGESFLINTGVDLRYHLNKRVDLTTAINLTHFSNGALKKPNFGINTIAPKISLKYNLYNTPVFPNEILPKYTPKNEYLVSIFGGIKNVIFDSVNVDLLEKYEGLDFAILGLALQFNRQINYKSKIGFGVNLAYDGSREAQISVDNNELELKAGKFENELQVSIFPSYELVINRFSLLLQPAFYIYRKNIKNQTPVFHQRIGLKYHINSNCFVAIILRDYQFHVSDFVEWTIGYSFYK